MSSFQISVAFLAQIVVVVLACRLVGRLVRPLGQPPVVAEMITGVLLGPSLLGWLAPELQSTLFPRESLPVIYTVAQVGLSLYMFLVGLELDLTRIGARVRGAVGVSWAGILVPFALGAGVAAWLADDFPLFASGVARWEQMLFMGAAMSITAFPMLARILHERGLTGTSLGTLALTAGALDDAAAWAVLAVVLASFGKSPEIAILAIGGGAIYAASMLTWGRRLLRWHFGSLLAKGEAGRAAILPSVVAMVAAAAWLTDTLGIYAVFGAFVLGAAMPKELIADQLEREIGPLATVLLLPFFFVNSGLNTRIALVDSWALAGVTLVVLLAACVGKFVACAAAARWAGEPARDALAIGALMNSRGLMELIILNIGLEHGVITPTLFTVMVLMAVVTTLMAGPAFDLIQRRGSAPVGN